MQAVPQVFSTRELSVILWGIAFLVFVIWRQEVLNSILNLIKVFVSKSILTYTGSMFLYVASNIVLLNRVGFWDSSMLKDTIIWFSTVALVMFINITKINNIGYFMNVLKDCAKGTLILEFLVNLYTFNIFIELIFIPIITLLVLTREYAKYQKENIQVHMFLDRSISFIGYLILLFVIYKSVVSYSTLFTIAHLKDLLLPILLTILFLPFIYIFTLYCNYESLFVRIKFMTNDIQIKKKLKRNILLIANINLNKVKSIDSKLKKHDVYANHDLSEYLKSIANQKI